MQLKRQRHVRIGRLGTFRFSTGAYVYVGSAWGPGGLTTRLGRHLRPEKNCHWHIDYLRRYAAIIGIWVGRCRPHDEHLWADTIGSMDSAVIPARNFGSSDCRCPSHLFRLADPPSIRRFNRVLIDHHCGKQRAHFWPGNR
jgi:Uri superfamily endonuclease